MVRRFIYKKINDKISLRKQLKSSSINEPKLPSIIEDKKEEVVIKEDLENKEDIKEIQVMDTKEKIQMAAAVLNNEQPKVKKVKKDKGLIERTESSITILTEDNRELLKD